MSVQSDVVETDCAAVALDYVVLGVAGAEVGGLWRWKGGRVVEDRHWRVQLMRT